MSDAEYAEPFVPEGRLVELISKDRGETTKDSVVERVCDGELESDTVKVTEVLPLEVVVPEMRPLLETASPTGSVLEDQV